MRPNTLPSRKERNVSNSFLYKLKIFIWIFSVTLENATLPQITTGGVVLVTGAGDVGQLGLGPDVLEKSRPAQISLNEEIVDVCAGGMHTVCLTAEGKVRYTTIK